MQSLGVIRTDFSWVEQEKNQYYKRYAGQNSSFDSLIYTKSPRNMLIWNALTISILLSIWILISYLTFTTRLVVGRCLEPVMNNVRSRICMTMEQFFLFSAVTLIFTCLRIFIKG